MGPWISILLFYSLWNEAYKINYAWLFKKSSLFLSVLNLWSENYFSYIKKNDHSECTSCFLLTGGQWELKLSSGQPGTPKGDLGIFPDYRNYCWDLTDRPPGRREREVEGVGGDGGVIKPPKLYFKLWIYCSESDSGPFRREVLSISETLGTTKTTQLLLLRSKYAKIVVPMSPAPAQKAKSTGRM